MERLQRRSDDICETRSGLFAVTPLRISGQSAEINEFQFRINPVQPPITVRWRKEDGIAVIEQGTALQMLKRNYARTISDAELARWNDLIDKMHPDALSPTPVAIVPKPEPLLTDENMAALLEGNKDLLEQPAGTQQQPEATKAPAAPETPPEGQEKGAEGNAAGEAPPVATPQEASEGDKPPEEQEQEKSGSEESTDEEKSPPETETEAEEEAPKAKSKAKKGALI